MIRNHEAEQAVIGTILLEGSLIQDIILHPEHFSRPNHQMIFQAMRKIEKNEQPITIVSVVTELGGQLPSAGGVSYLKDLATSVPTTETLRHDQRLVLDAYRNRKTQERALTYAKNPSDTSLDELIQGLEDLRKVGVEKKDKTTYDHLVDIATDMVTPRKSGYTGFSTGYEDLDRMTGGTQRGDLIIIAARPSMGKTAFALNIAANHCDDGGTSHIFSLEMGTKQLIQRMVSAQGKIDGQKWRSMSFSADDYKQALGAIGRIADWKLHIYERERTVQDIRAQVRQAIKADPAGEHMILIDYLQLMASSGRYERRDLEVGAMTRELKLLARELNVPIILLSQLSRAVEQRQDKRPMMSDLRESGNIEQDADVIGFLYRDDYYHRDSERENVIEVLLSKQRNGPVGNVVLCFEKEYGRFVGLDGGQSRSKIAR